MTSTEAQTTVPAPSPNKHIQFGIRSVTQSEFEALCKRVNEQHLATATRIHESETALAAIDDRMHDSKASLAAIGNHVTSQGSRLYKLSDTLVDHGARLVSQREDIDEHDGIIETLKAAFENMEQRLSQAELEMERRTHADEESTTASSTTANQDTLALRDDFEALKISCMERLTALEHAVAYMESDVNALKMPQQSAPNKPSPPLVSSDDISRAERLLTIMKNHDSMRDNLTIQINGHTVVSRTQTNDERIYNVYI